MSERVAPHELEPPKLRPGVFVLTTNIQPPSVHLPAYLCVQARLITEDGSIQRSITLQLDGDIHLAERIAMDLCIEAQARLEA